MGGLAETVKTADWKNEKHVPVIECKDQAQAGEVVQVKVCVGKAVAHPNTTEHHIRWIALYFHPQGAPVPCEVARVEFTAHGESGAGPNQGPVYTQSEAAVSLKLAKGGTLMALSYCNIHGLWSSTKDVAVA